MFKAVCVSASLSLSAFAAVLLASPRRGVGGGGGMGNCAAPRRLTKKIVVAPSKPCRADPDSTSQTASERASECCGGCGD